MSSSTDPIVADFVGGHAQFYYGTETNKLHKRSNQICEEIDKNKDDIKKLDTKVETYNDNTKQVLHSHETELKKHNDEIDDLKKENKIIEGAFEDQEKVYNTKFETLNKKTTHMNEDGDFNGKPTFNKGFRFKDSIVDSSKYHTSGEIINSIRVTNKIPYEYISYLYKKEI